MLYILTGDIQIGKTRWLQRLIADLDAAGVQTVGVLAPGVWRERTLENPGVVGAAAGNSEIYEKLGINNQLLPSGETIPFARRRDLVQAEGAYDEESQSAKAQLGWAIDDAAIAHVNEYFAQLQSAQDRASMGLSAETPALLVVDELGQLELKRGGGLTQAMTLLREGSSRQFPHAIIVVREWLVPDAVAQLGVAWKDYAPIGPTDEAHDCILSACGVKSCT